MSDRFYLPVPLEYGEVELTGSELHHLSHVVRHQVGDCVELFDGLGNQAQAEILSISKKLATLRLLADSRTCEAPAERLILATAAPKGDRLRWLVEKATELGVDRLIPLTTTRSVVDPRAGKLQKLQQTVIAACKQCGRSRLMDIDSPTSFSELITGQICEAGFWLAHPQGQPVSECLAKWSSSSPALPLVAVVGPEGGFDTAEIELATQHGAQFVDLGARILRTETAAITMAALMGLTRGDV